MGWMQKLCEAYDVGIVSDQSAEKKPLVPVGFFREAVKYQVVLNKDGNFVSANELNKKRTEKGKKNAPEEWEIPVTVRRESYTGDSGTLRPLITKLKYLVYSDATSKWFLEYMTLLRDWSEQEGAPDCLSKVYQYLDRKTILKDLESQSITLNYYKGKEKHEGFGSDADELVCFSVQTPDDSCDDLWKREDVKESWSRYYAATLLKNPKIGLCYVEGEKRPLLDVHPRVMGLGTPKLIPERDEGDFPLEYQGRFVAKKSSTQISVDASVRAHHALGWLIARQGLKKYDMTWVVWNTNGAIMHIPLDDASDLTGDDEEDEYEDGNCKPAVDTLYGYAEAANQAACGYKFDLEGYDTERVSRVCILGLKAPIPNKGNLAITYYQELLGNDYVARLKCWYRGCRWWGRYNPKTETTETKTPTSTEIAMAVMGRDSVEVAQGKGKKGTGAKDTDPQERKLARQLMSQLMMCIVDKQPLPLSMVNSAFHRCCNPLSFTSGKDKGWDRYGWNRSVNTACAMISCAQQRGNAPDREVFPPELQTASRNRDYLYGRLLAVADRMEEEVLELKPSLPTNAIRLTQRFAQRPFDTWQMIHEKLIPVFRAAGENAGRYQIAFEEIEGLFLEEDRMSPKPLHPEFLQGYSSQRQAWFTKRDKDGTAPEEAKKPTLYEVPTARSQLYGCLLAIADRVELEASDGERLGQTNAMQMMPAFAARPYESWGRLHDKLIPYMEKLGDKAGYYQTLIGRTEAQFSQADRESRKPLDSSYLHGYYGMLRTFYRKTQYCWTPQTWPEDAGELRSLWYGRMLGASEWLERRMLRIRAGGAPEDEALHATNALRHMAAFARKPATTWDYLKVKLQPYLRYGAEHTAASALLEQLEEQLKLHGWNTDTPLNSSYLHGYYAERNRKGE